MRSDHTEYVNNLLKHHLFETVQLIFISTLLREAVDCGSDFSLSVVKILLECLMFLGSGL